MMQFGLSFLALQGEGFHFPPPEKTKMMRADFLFLSLACALLVLLPPASGLRAQLPTTGTLAQRGETIRVGFVDIDLVLEESRAIRSIITEIDAELADEAGEIESKRAEAMRLRRELEQQDPLLSDDSRRQRQQQILDLLAEVEELELRFRRTIRERQQVSIEPLLEQVVIFIADVAERERFDLVVRGEAVLYGARRVDLTPEVVREIDRRGEELRRRVLPPGDLDDGPELLPLIP